MIKNIDKNFFLKNGWCIIKNFFSKQEIEIVNKEIVKFFKKNIKNYSGRDINFVGSVAYFLSDEIYKTAEKYGCKVGDIIKNPIDKLTSYHLINDIKPI